MIFIKQERINHLSAYLKPIRFSKPYRFLYQIITKIKFINNTLQINRWSVSQQNRTHFFLLCFFIIILILPACQDDEMPPSPPPEPGCQDTVLVNNVIITPHDRNVLRIDVEFETSESADIYINYWLADNMNEMKRSVLSSNLSAHKITLINMLSASDYVFQTVAMVDSCEYFGDLYSFTTEALPAAVPQITHHNLSYNFEGYILAHTNLPGTVFVLDSRGRVVWYEVFDGIAQVHTLSEKNTLAVMLGSLNYLEMDFFGNVLREHEYNVDHNDLIHHELLQNDEDDMLTLGVNAQNFDLSSVGGGTNDQVIADNIIQFAPDGTEKWRWNLLDHANPLDDPNILLNRTDWTHSNALAYDTDGHLLLSIRNFNQIWKINTQTDDVIWRLGINGDFTMDADDHFYRQHAIHLTPDGDLMLYDNGANSIRETSRAIIFDIDENNMIATTNLKIELPEDFYSDRQSNCMMIGEDRVLFANSIQRAIFITNLTGTFLWHVELPDSFYRAYYMENFY